MLQPITPFLLPISTVIYCVSCSMNCGVIVDITTGVHSNTYKDANTSF